MTYNYPADDYSVQVETSAIFIFPILRLTMFAGTSRPFH